MARLGVVGCKTTTLELLHDLVRSGFTVDAVVTLPPELGARHDVAGYLDLTPALADLGIPAHRPHTYALDHPDDRTEVLALGLDCVVVMGWQRLIPAWWLDALVLGAYGMHGSAEPLPRGRGRSPMNWAIHDGRDSFLTHLFRYDAGVDSGAVVARQRFDITPWDDCETTHFKNRMAMSRLLRRHLGEILDGTVTTIPQNPTIEPTYLPKRTAEDGRIRWADHHVRSLHDHVRCQTRPFPGAFSHLNGSAERCMIWRGQPFDRHLTDLDELPGTVVERFHDDSFLVTVWDGSYLVRDYTSPDGPPAVGDRFTDEPA